MFCRLHWADWQTLNKRCYEHISSVKKSDERSVVAVHSIEYNHTFDFNDAVILDFEGNKIKREFSEMLNIYFHNNNVNRKHDIFYLKNLYKKSIDNTRKFFK